MDYVNTGIERCKTLTIDKRSGGASLIGYPKSYDILLAFTVGDVSHGVITEENFQRLSESIYNERLGDFKKYVESAESIVSINDITVPGFEAYRQNLNSCPV